MTIEQAAAQLRAREISSVELTRGALRRIHTQQPRLNAFITVTEELALQQAALADDELARGIDRGPLHGIPYALKDNFATRGIRTTSGAAIFASHTPVYDSAVYEKLTGAGAVLTGKTGMHELAYGITNNNPHFGAVRNPRDPARIPGGSSGGSGAAVAAALVCFAMGSDTGGSIRIPAAYCGCVGFKPTAGRVSRYGLMPLSTTLDHAGPLTQTVRDAGLVMNAIAGFDPRDPDSSRQPLASYLAEAAGSIEGVRVGVPRNFFNERLTQPVAAAFDRVLRKAKARGARLVPVDLPDPEEVNTLGRMILLSEAAALMEPHLGDRGRFGPDVLALLDQGCLLAATDYVNALRLRRTMQRRWAGVWEQMDVVFTPTVPTQAPGIGEETIPGEPPEDVRLASTRFVRAWNVLGWPAVSIPCHLKGLPIGLQLTGPPFGDSRLLQIARVLETEVGARAAR